MEKSLKLYCCICFSSLNTALSMELEGLPTLLIQSFIMLKLLFSPSMAPTTVPRGEFWHQPFTPSSCAFPWVYFLKKTPCTLPKTSKSHLHSSDIELPRRRTEDIRSPRRRKRCGCRLSDM